MAQDPGEFAEDLLVLEQVLANRARGARGDAGAAAFAERLVEDRHLLRVVEFDGDGRATSLEEKPAKQ